MFRSYIGLPKVPTTNQRFEVGHFGVPSGVIKHGSENPYDGGFQFPVRKNHLFQWSIFQPCLMTPEANYSL